MKLTNPAADVWATIYHKLSRAWEDSGSFGTPPPRPIVRDGRLIASDDEKRDRWRDTVNWAVDQGFEDLIPRLFKTERPEKT